MRGWPMCLAQRRPERLLARTSCVIKQLNRSYQQQGGVLHRPGGEPGKRESWKCLWTHGARHEFLQAGKLKDGKSRQQFIN